MCRKNPGLGRGFLWGIAAHFRTDSVSLTFTLAEGAGLESLS